jgi:hypothetical protein
MQQLPGKRVPPLLDFDSTDWCRKTDTFFKVLTA